MIELDPLAIAQLRRTLLETPAGAPRKPKPDAAQGQSGSVNLASPADQFAELMRARLR